MSRTAGVYTAPASSWNPAVNGASATLADWTALLTDISNALTTSVSSDGQTTPSANLPMGGFKFTGIGNGTGATDSAAFGQIAPPAQCRLTKSGLNLLLSPFNGNRLVVNGVYCTIPAAGVTLVPSGLSNNTAYYIYAVATAGVVTSLEPSTTAPVADTTTVGVKVKTGDATRTLVGQAVATSATVWSVSVLHCLSYFNRRTLKDKATFTVNRLNSTTYSTFLETNSEIRVPFLNWADDTPVAIFEGTVTQATSGGVSYSGIGFDTTSTPEDGVSVFNAFGANAVGSCTNIAPTTGLAEATLHYATQLGANTAGNGVWAGSANAYSRSSLQVTLQG